MAKRPRSNIPAVGIDLGTSNASVGFEFNGTVTLLADAQGRTVFPSVVSYLSDGRVLTGVAAKNRATIAPMTTVTSVKRLIGRTIEEVEQHQLQERYAIPILDDGRHGIVLQVGSERISPIDVEAEILRSLREIGSMALSQPVQRAVVTVPASFQHRHREATVEAAARADIETLRLLNEPTAAALAFGHRTESSETILVYDFGGGTFDVTVLDRNASFYEVRATTGRPFLGGDDFDFKIASRIVESLAHDHRIVVPDSVRHKLLPAAERIKIDLSRSEATSAGISTQWLGAVENRTIDVEIERAEFESLIRPSVIETLEAVDEVLATAGKKINDVDRVLLVGGTTRVPLVRKMVMAYFGKRPEQSVSPEIAVARGAAHYAALLAGPQTRTRRHPRQMKLVDVVPTALSVETVAGLCEPIIERNARLPAKRSREYTTSTDGQRHARIRVYQGTSRYARDNQLLGEVILDQLPEGGRGLSRIVVTFEVNPNGILEVSAIERTSSKSCNARLLINDFRG